MNHHRRLERLSSMERGHFWSVGRDELCDAMIERFDMRAPIVDLGAGTGAYARRLARRGRTVYRLDLGPVEAPGVRADATRLPFAEGSIATLLARDVLEHVDDVAALIECRRVVRPGGHLLTSVPGWPSLWGSRDVAAGHRRRYRRSQLRERLRTAGFEVLELRGYQFFLRPIGALARIVQRHGGRRALAREEKVPMPLNRAFAAVNRLEARLARRSVLKPPTGSSLFAVAQVS